MKVIYIAGKYSGKNGWEVKKNIMLAEEAAVEVWLTKKAAAICPHANTAHWTDLLTHQEFIDGDLAIIDRCDAVYFLPGWSDSKGAVLENAHALNKGVPCFFSMLELHDFINTSEESNAD